MINDIRKLLGYKVVSVILHLSPPTFLFCIPCWAGFGLSCVFTLSTWHQCCIQSHTVFHLQYSILFFLNQIYSIEGMAMYLIPIKKWLAEYGCMNTTFSIFPWLSVIPPSSIHSSKCLPCRQLNVKSQWRLKDKKLHKQRSWAQDLFNYSLTSIPVLQQIYTGHTDFLKFKTQMSDAFIICSISYY